MTDVGPGIPLSPGRPRGGRPGCRHRNPQLPTQELVVAVCWNAV